jgi:hypothetical protein
MRLVVCTVVKLVSILKAEILVLVNQFYFTYYPETFDWCLVECSAVRVKQLLFTYNADTTSK